MKNKTKVNTNIDNKNQTKPMDPLDRIIENMRFTGFTKLQPSKKRLEEKPQ